MFNPFRSCLNVAPMFQIHVQMKFKWHSWCLFRQPHYNIHSRLEFCQNFPYKWLRFYLKKSQYFFIQPFTEKFKTAFNHIVNSMQAIMWGDATVYNSPVAIYAAILRTGNRTKFVSYSMPALIISQQEKAPRLCNPSQFLYRPTSYNEVMPPALYWYDAVWYYSIGRAICNCLMIIRTDDHWFRINS